MTTPYQAGDLVQATRWTRWPWWRRAMAWLTRNPERGTYETYTYRCEGHVVGGAGGGVSDGASGVAGSSGSWGGAGGAGRRRYTVGELGFTWDDVDAITQAASSPELTYRSGDFGDEVTPNPDLIRVANRIAALLPPREQ